MSGSPSAQHPPHPRRRRRALRIAIALCVALVVASNIAILIRGPRTQAHDPAVRSIECPTIDHSASPIPSGRWPATTRFAYYLWRPDPAADAARASADRDVPILYLHGGPGHGREFETGIQVLAARGYTVLAPDLLGLGETTHNVPDCSFTANAEACTRLLDALAIDRVHLVAYSQGGGVALELADRHPERIASITMLAAVASQRTEGSGSYTFEHARYRLGNAASTVLYHLIPHFGAIPPVPRGALAYFSDSDQRPLESHLRELDVPVFFLHGDQDFLVPPSAAREHFRAAIAAERDARILLTRHSHFMPLIPAQARETAAWIHRFLSADPLLGTGAMLFERPGRPRFERTLDALFRAARVNVWLTMLIIAVCAALKPRTTTAAAALLIALLVLDYGVAFIGLLLPVAAALAFGPLLRTLSPFKQDPASALDLARRVQRRGHFRVHVYASLRPDLVHEALVSAIHRRRPGPCLAASAGVLAARAFRLAAALILATALAALIARPPAFPLGIASPILAFLGAYLGVFIADHLFTRLSRRLLGARIRRWLRYEFWSPWLFYAPLFPLWTWLTLRTRHPLAFTASNPGMTAGGGFLGESKAQIMHALGGPLLRGGSHSALAEALSPTFLSPPNLSPAARAAWVRDLQAQHPDILCFPIILKPDQGYRGFALKLARTDADIDAYCATMTRPFVVQPFHPGPEEVGICWARDLAAAGPRSPAPVRAGTEPVRGGGILSITRKVLPTITGDGTHTLEELILRHPRYRLQAPIFLARHRADRSRIPASGETIRLAVAGNHCQGTLFLDAADLITPELTRVINDLALNFRHRDGTGEGGGLDFGRFDIRARSLEDLRAGKLDRWSVIELNGTTAESTNIYDPDMSIFTAYRYLFAQWRILYTLGAERTRREGHRPLRIREVLTALIRNYYRRPGSAISD